MKAIDHWIGGTTVEGTSGRSGPVFDPATGAESGRVAYAGAAEVDRAVAAAKDAFGSWRQSSLAARTRILFAYRDLIDRHRAQPLDARMAEAMSVSADKERELLAVMAGRAGLGDPQAARVGAEIEARARKSVVLAA